MPLFMTDSELETEGGNIEVVVSKADAFIRELQEQLEAQKHASEELEQKLAAVGLCAVADVLSLDFRLLTPFIKFASIVIDLRSDLACTFALISARVSH